jgi:predicted dehydrogenase
MMADPVTILLMGIGGYGEAYVSALLDENQGKRCRIVGAVDPEPSRCSRLVDLERLGIPTYASLDLFFRESNADLAVISSPIQLHAEHVEETLIHGCHVLVEKPAAASTKDVDRMIETRDRIERFVAVGYQWSFAGSIMRLKNDILGGMFGAPKRAKCLTLWPRTDAYYARNEWAGRERDTAGRPIFDSPANNAMAHFLHNLLFLLGDEMDRAAEPEAVTTHLARANDIETFDTIAALVKTTNDVDVFFYASHAIAEHEAVEPQFQLEFEDAVIDFPGEMHSITAQFKDGMTIEYPSPNASVHARKLWACVDAVIGGGPVPCGLEAARSQVRCIEMIHGTGAEEQEKRAEVQVHRFRTEKIHIAETQEGQLRWVEGLAEAMQGAYERGELIDLRSVN